QAHPLRDPRSDVAFARWAPLRSTRARGEDAPRPQPAHLPLPVHVPEVEGEQRAVALEGIEVVARIRLWISLGRCDHAPSPRTVGDMEVLRELSVALLRRDPRPPPAGDADVEEEVGVDARVDAPRALAELPHEERRALRLLRGGGRRTVSDDCREDGD